jgi:hypothetical protein
LKPQTNLLFGETEHEVFGEASGIPLDCQVERLRGHLVKLRQIAVQHHLVPADQENTLLYDLDRDQGLLSHFLRHLP